MKPLSIQTVAIIATFLIGSPVIAQNTPPSQEAIEAAGRLIHATKYYERIVDAPNDTTDVDLLADCIANRDENTEYKNDCSEEVKASRQMMQRFRAIRSERRANLLYAAEVAYAERLSVDDMKAAATFFESPVGQRFLTASPAIYAAYQAENRRIMLEAVTAQPSK